MERKGDTDSVKLVVDGTAPVGRPRKTWQAGTTLCLLTCIDLKFSLMNWSDVGWHWQTQQHLEHCLKTKDDD